MFDKKDIENRFTYHAPKGDQQEKYSRIQWVQSDGGDDK